MQLKQAFPFRSRLKKFSLAFFACSAVLTGYLLTRHPAFRLTLEMSSSVTSTSVAQLFYNTGVGFNEKESQSVLAVSGSLDTFQKLSFGIPRSTVLGFRFDPLTTEGTVTLRNVAIRGPNGFLQAISPADIIPFSQIKARAQRGDEVSFTTESGANDPGLTIGLSRPFLSKRMRAIAKIRTILTANAILLVVLAALFGMENALRQTHSRFEKLGVKLSKSGFVKVDAHALWFYLVCVGCFVGAVAADLNGSSAEVYSRVYGYGFENAPLIGSSQETRSDEWVYHTPAMLFEVIRPDRFAVNPSPPGNHSIALTANLPLRHFTTLFRPQFWPFFVLPPDYAYSAYWQFKALVLVSGVFTFLLLLTGSTFWSGTGALWYFFSPLTQWDYSWASLLPEMVGLICFIVVLCCYLTVGRNPLLLLIAALLTGACAVNFTLCAYLPHLIPLLWFAIFAFGFWCYGNRGKIFTKPFARRRTAALLLAFGIPAVAGVFIFGELHQAIAAVSATLYPGQREMPGGTLPFRELFSYLFAWTETDLHLPPALGNICEGSGYLLLAPAALFCLSRVELSKSQKCLLTGLWSCLAFLLIWCTAPIPAEWGRLLGLDKTGAARVVPALGLLNISIVILTMASMQKRLIRWPKVVTHFLFAAAVVTAMLLYANNSYGGYFSNVEILVALSITTLLIVFLIEGRKLAFAIGLIVPQVYAFGTVNPIERGLTVFTESQLFSFVDQHPELRNGRWLVYSDSVVPSGFFTAAGCPTYSGLNYMPDIDHFSTLAAHGLDTKLFNRDGYLTAHPLNAGMKSSAELVTPGLIRWSVSASDPILPQLGIKYVAFDPKPTDEMIIGLVPISKGPKDKFWLYRIP